MPLRRRTFIRTTALGLAAAPLVMRHAPARAEAPLGPPLGPPQPFSHEGLIERARKRAEQPYAPPPRPAPKLVKRINYDVHGKLRYKPSRALHADAPGGYPVTFFHLGMFFTKSVKIHTVENRQAREVRYDPSLFDMPEDSIARALPKDSGFAGFRFQEVSSRADWPTQDWLAFLGASYFRAIGALGQYGLSARGIAVNTSAAPGEEFPDFVEFFIAPSEGAGKPVMVYALLDGPSVTGAYRFACQRGTGVIMDVDAALFMRADVAQLGIAPLTSMYFFSEYDKEFRADWRPEVHDSDGLLLWTGAGQRILRPLNAPTRVITSSFFDNNPRGFGLMQRDRCFQHYLDGVNYDKRPSLWVQPLDEWGPGSVQLIEIPTRDEYHDNIVAFWVPDKPAKRGDHLRFRYRLHWLAKQPFPAPELAQVAATRIGRVVGDDQPEGRLRFVVEFAGGPSATPDRVKPKVEVSAGVMRGLMTEQVPHSKRLRVQFDLDPPEGQTLELRAHLVQGDRIASEIWSHQLEVR